MSGLPQALVLTAAQYEALPPDTRIELVDGVAQVKPTATRRHQIVVQKVLAIEVVSPHTQTTDRLHKPAEYATAAIEHFWRVEIAPQIAVHTYRLADSGRYTASGLFTPGDAVMAAGLRWASIAVDDLAP